MENRRIFLIVMDSVGVGEAKDAKAFGDEGANTFLHAYQATNNKMEMLSDLGMTNLVGLTNKETIGYYLKIQEESNGKDTLTGHLEMMGIITKEPLKTFTETGFPEELIHTLEEKIGRKVLCNKAYSGTDVIKDYGLEHMQTGSIILYTSADSVLQIASHEDIIPINELYNICSIARELTKNPKYKVGRVIARPFKGSNGNFERTSNRKDFALDPPGKTILDNLKDNSYDVIAIGKISDIFNNNGITEKIHTENNLDGLNKVLDIVKNKDFNGLCFANLNDFDSKYGHRRDPIGYSNALEETSIYLEEIFNHLRDNDIIMVTADHGNDPIHHGSDHTREYIPLMIYSKSFQNKGLLNTEQTFSVIGSTIADYFNIPKIYGHSLKDKLN